MIVLLFVVPIVGATLGLVAEWRRSAAGPIIVLASLGLELGLALSLVTRGSAEGQSLFDLNLTLAPVGALLLAVATVATIVGIWTDDSGDDRDCPSVWLLALAGVVLGIESSASLPTSALALTLSTVIFILASSKSTAADPSQRVLAWAVLAGAALIFASALDTLSQQPGHFAIVPASLAGPIAALLVVGIGTGLAALPFSPWLLALATAEPRRAAIAAGLIGSGTSSILIAQTTGAPWLLDQAAVRSTLVVVCVLAAIVSAFLAIGSKQPARVVAFLAGASSNLALAAVATNPSMYLPAATWILVAQLLATTVGLAALAGLGGQLSGGFWRRPALALGLTVASFSLVGLPPTAGYVGRLLANRDASTAVIAGFALASILGGFAVIRAFLPLLDPTGLERSGSSLEQHAFPLDVAVLALSLVLLLGGWLPGPLAGILH